MVNRSESTAGKQMVIIIYEIADLVPRERGLHYDSATSAIRTIDLRPISDQ